VDKNVPLCVGVIADGNRRWAREQGLPGFVGHKYGYEKFKEMALWAKEAGIKYVIIYAFSTENWGRSEHEIGRLLTLFRHALSPKETVFFRKEGIRISVIGERERLPQDIQEGICSAERESADFSELHFIFAISYGGRSEILSSAKDIVREKGAEGMLSMTEDGFEKFLWTGRIHVPDPDIIIRTGKQRRTSNFLLWQAAYSELYFSDAYWPEFSKEEFKTILGDYSERKRNFGK